MQDPLKMDSRCFLVSAHDGVSLNACKMIWLNLLVSLTSSGLLWSPAAKLLGDAVQSYLCRHRQSAFSFCQAQSGSVKLSSKVFRVRQAFVSHNQTSTRDYFRQFQCRGQSGSH